MPKQHLWNRKSSDMFANLVAAPFIFASIILLYMAWEVDSDYAIWIVPAVLSSAVVYIFGPQINWWWYSKNPPKLSPGLLALLERFSVSYKRLDEAGKLKFRSRVALFTMGTDWEQMAWPDEVLPPDVQTVIAAQAVTVSFHKERFLFDQFEKIIVFPAPFSTPEYPFDHASELFAEDGCLLFSARQVMMAFMQPGSWYNVALHEYARVYARAYPKEHWPVLPEETIWEKLEEVSGMQRSHVESVIGLAGTEPLPVAIHHYFTFPESFKKVMPEAFEALESVFMAQKG